VKIYSLVLLDGTSQIAPDVVNAVCEERFKIANVFCADIQSDFLYDPAKGRTVDPHIGFVQLPLAGLTDRMSRAFKQPFTEATGTLAALPPAQTCET
jgi:hypothetical protein